MYFPYSRVTILESLRYNSAAITFFREVYEGVDQPPRRRRRRQPRCCTANFRLIFRRLHFSLIILRAIQFILAVGKCRAVNSIFRSPHVTGSATNGRKPTVHLIVSKKSYMDTHNQKLLHSVLSPTNSGIESAQFRAEL